MDARTIAQSIKGRLRAPTSAERLAKEIDAPLLLVQEVLRKETRKKGAWLVAVGVKTEDGEARIMFQAKENVNG
jgi:hypothetical protein